MGIKGLRAALAPNQLRYTSARRGCARACLRVPARVRRGAAPLNDALPPGAAARRPGHVKEFSGQVLAIDAFAWLHRGAFSCALELATGQVPARARVLVGRSRRASSSGNLGRVRGSAGVTPSAGATLRRGARAAGGADRVHRLCAADHAAHRLLPAFDRDAAALWRDADCGARRRAVAGEAVAECGIRRKGREGVQTGLGRAWR